MYAEVKCLIYVTIRGVYEELEVLLNEEHHLIGVFDAEFVKQEFEIILGAEASVHKISFYILPVSESVIIEHLQLFGYDERHMSKTKTFLSLAQ